MATQRAGSRRCADELMVAGGRGPCLLSYDVLSGSKRH